MPFHMHINLEMVEGVYLTCAALLEGPNIAAHPLASSRRVISKPYLRLLETYKNQVRHSQIQLNWRLSHGFTGKYLATCSRLEACLRLPVCNVVRTFSWVLLCSIYVTLVCACGHRRARGSARLCVIMCAHLVNLTHSRVHAGGQRATS